MNDGGPAPRRDFLRDGGWRHREALEALIATPPDAQPLAAFDFDDTVIDGDLSLTLLDHLDPTGDAKRAYEADCEVDVRSGYATLVETLIAGRTELEVRELTVTALDAALASGRIRFRPAIRELIWALQRHRWTVYFVTASPAVVVAVAAQRVGIPADHVLGMWCRQDEEGRFVAPTQEPITYRDGKVQALRSREERPLTLAAGDALTDLELLEHARFALVLDKGNKQLLQAAEKHGWWVEDSL